MIQCLDVALRGSMSLRPEVATFARGFFLPPGPRPSPSIGNGAEVSARANISYPCCDTPGHSCPGATEEAAMQHVAQTPTRYSVKAAAENLSRIHSLKSSSAACGKYA